MAFDESNWSELIPPLCEWSGVTDFNATDWISNKGNYDLAIGYSRLFWPTFKRFEDYVLRDERFDEVNLRTWEVDTGGDKVAIETVLNHVHIADIHSDTDGSEAQLRYLGRVLAHIHRAKLAADYPDLIFEVSFNDEPGLDPLDYQLTFWQPRTSKAQL